MKYQIRIVPEIVIDGIEYWTAFDFTEGVIWVAADCPPDELAINLGLAVAVAERGAA